MKRANNNIQFERNVLQTTILTDFNEFPRFAYEMDSKFIKRKETTTNSNSDMVKSFPIKWIQHSTSNVRENE